MGDAKLLIFPGTFRGEEELAAETELALCREQVEQRIRGALQVMVLGAFSPESMDEALGKYDIASIKMTEMGRPALESASMEFLVRLQIRLPSGSMVWLSTRVTVGP